MSRLYALFAVVALVLVPNPVAAKHGPPRHYLNGRYGLTRTTWYDYGSITASGRGVFYGEVATDPSIPFGARMHVPGLGTFVVLDRGGAVWGAHIDIYQPYAGYRAIDDYYQGVWWD